LTQTLGWSLPAERFAWSPVEFLGDVFEVFEVFEGRRPTN
jgi:hypothetical protein